MGDPSGVGSGLPNNNYKATSQFGNGHASITMHNSDAIGFKRNNSKDKRVASMINFKQGSLVSNGGNTTNNLFMP